ncbi:MAG: AraC family transcriptional regulator [Chitinophaga sp.]|uniref:AraC family transcriptional regulator n=1 Tax=Chitinophaga sp. TaxID=1869181 RepID=UPI001B1493D6|nr:helix-turn-helix domain-containing protein [Chitinophaga sp.]MBO9732645.1 AraC family transcriptional regulator [Chitinophaga sp.]
MDARIILPVAPLRKYIRFFWLLENNSADIIEKFKVIPDGAPGLVFQENPAVVYKDNQTLPTSFLFGQATQYLEMSARGHFRNIGVSFQPTALQPVFGVAASELTQRHIDLNDLLYTSISEQLMNESSTTGRIAALEQFFLRLTANSKSEDDQVRYAIRQFQQGGELKQVQTALQISERSLERMFKKHVGLSPKLYARICRFQATLKALRTTPVASLTELAYLENYFDQSHFIRDFKFFAGTTPGAFLQDAKERFPDFSV